MDIHIDLSTGSVHLNTVEVASPGLDILRLKKSISEQSLTYSLREGKHHKTYFRFEKNLSFLDSYVEALVVKYMKKDCNACIIHLIVSDKKQREVIFESVFNGMKADVEAHKFSWGKIQFYSDAHYSGAISLVMTFKSAKPMRSPSTSSLREPQVYSLLSLIRASLVENCQSTLDCLEFLSSFQARVRVRISSRVGILSSRYWRLYTLSSISATLSQLPCFGV
jgi:hypothetical protein